MLNKRSQTKNKNKNEQTKKGVYCMISFKIRSGVAWRCGGSVVGRNSQERIIKGQEKTFRNYG